MNDYVTGTCASACVDYSKCSLPAPPCPYRPIMNESDFAYYSTCKEVCGLHLDDMPNFNPLLYSAFWNITSVRGHLSVTNNKYIYALDFLPNLRAVRCNEEGRMVFLLLQLIFLVKV